MKSDIVSKKYAKALFLLFKDENQRDIQKILESFQMAMNSYETFKRFFYEENITQNKKKELLERCLKNKYLVNFLMLLIKKRRLKYLSKINKEYRYLIFKSLNILEGEIILAKNENSSLKETFTKKLENQSDQTIEWKEKIDPSLIDGAILIVHNQLLDMSTKGQIKQLQERLLSNEYMRK